MKELDPPPPLDAVQDTPEELRAVLRALGREAPGRGTLQCVARELEPYMDAAPGLSVPVSAAVRTGGKLLAVRAIAALFALGAGVYLAQRVWPREEGARGVGVATPVASAPVASAPVASAPLAELAAAPDAASQTIAPAAAPPAVLAQPAGVERVRRHHRGQRTRAVMPVPAIAAAPVAATEVTTAESPMPDPAAPAHRHEAPPAPQSQAHKLAEPPPDEVALLFQARERLRSDPAAALSLLEAAANRFAEGQLAPEREVLAIEALRLLKRSDEADARVRAFRARYPGSIHLRRLQKGQ